MTNPPTKEYLKQVEERLKAATPGPWYTVDQGWLPRYTNTYLVAGNFDPHIGKPLLDVDYECDDWDGQVQADYEFCAAARTDIPILLAEVRRLREALEVYADPDNWMHHEEFQDETRYILYRDSIFRKGSKGYSIARQALGEEAGRE